MSRMPTDDVYQQLRALTSWALSGRTESDSNSWSDAPDTFVYLIGELDRRLTSGEQLLDTWALLRGTPDEANRLRPVRNRATLLGNVRDRPAGTGFDQYRLRPRRHHARRDLERLDR
jgi:hypothetical protein